MDKITDINFETPILPLNYTDKEQNKYFMKRDDLLPFSFGGNKVRISAEYFKDLVTQGHDSIISYGNSRSNMNRVIANMSSALGIPCYIVSPVEENGHLLETNNTKIINKFEAKIIETDKNNVANTVENLIEDLKSTGLNPYYINGDKYGRGNEKIPVSAYVKVYDEIRSYENENNKEFDFVFHASGTGSTQAGLLCGSFLKKDNKKIVGISVAREESVGKESIKLNMEAYLEEKIDKELAENIFFTDDYLAGGYGKYHDQIKKVIDEVLTYDGVYLDRTYTGKAFWGMTEFIEKNKIKNSNILFVHTGSTPLFFDDLNN